MNNTVKLTRRKITQLVLRKVKLSNQHLTYIHAKALMGILKGSRGTESTWEEDPVGRQASPPPLCRSVGRQVVWVG